MHYAAFGGLSWYGEQRIDMTFKAHLPGMLVTVAISLCAAYLSTLHESFDALVISIIIGMFLGNLLSDRRTIRAGVETGIRIFLPVGIALYGSQLSLTGLKGGTVFSIIVVFAALFVLTFVLARLFRLNDTMSVLLASGISVCGASAIAVIAPLISAKREDTSIAVISVMMLGLIGMIFYPLIADFFQLSRDEFIFFSGTTLPMIGQVKVAVGMLFPDYLNGALQIKLVRVACLLFIVPLASLLSGTEGQRIRIPWFAGAFVLLALLVNGAPLPQSIVGVCRNLSTFCLSAGLAATGLSVDFDAIMQEGMTPVGVISSSWCIVLLVIYLLKDII